MFVRNAKEVNSRKDAVVVPECSYSYDDGTIKSEYVDVAYRIEKESVTMWTSDVTWYTPYLLDILFVKQGMTFVHGAGVSVNSQYGELILAFGGIGKTCFIANAARKESVKILGDDLILVSENGELYSYPRPFCLYEYHKVLFPQYFDNHKVKYVHIEKDMYFRRGIRFLKKHLGINDKNVYSFVPVSPVRLFEKNKVEIQPVKIDGVYVLRRNQSYNSVKISKKLSDVEAANFALSVILHEWDIGLKIILNHHAQQFVNFEDYIKPRNEILNKAFRFANSISLVEIPEKMSATDVSIALNNTILEGIK